MRITTEHECDLLAQILVDEHVITHSVRASFKQLSLPSRFLLVEGFASNLPDDRKKHVRNRYDNATKASMS